MNVPKNPLAPHRLTVFIEARVEELLPTGECSGRPTLKVARFPIWKDFDNQKEAEESLEEFMKEVKEACLT